MQNKKLLVGITGGVGSGKTLACRFFEKLGYRVIYADKIVKRLYKTNSSLKNKLVRKFGKTLLNEKGKISQIKTRKVIFSNKSNIKRVNKIVHPFAIREIDRLIKNIKDKIILIETAILFESCYYKKLDYNVLIYSNKKNRVLRVRKRDKVSAAEVEKLMSFQMTEREKLKRADFVLKNNYRIKDLEKSIGAFNEILIHLM